MARVVLPRQVNHLTGGDTEVTVAADDYRGLIAVLEQRYPGLGVALQDDLAVVIDGDIVNDPLLEAIGPDSEIHFMPRISGG